MTAEIAILNKSGIALAADSAVTVGSVSQQKVFNSANKLFSLSKYHPVGIMIYGNAEFMSIPWETAVKIYRSNLGKRNFSTLESYADDFFQFLRDTKQFRDKKAQDVHVRSVFTSHLTDLLNVTNKELSDRFKTTEPSESDVRVVLGEIVKSYIDQLVNLETYSGYSESDVPSILAEYLTTIDSVIGEMIHITLPEDVVNTLRLAAAYLLTKDVYYADTSGVVIAGYGEDEVYPSLYEYRVEGIINGVLKYTTGQTASVSSTMTAAIRPFAQQEMVHAFMEGIDPEFRNILMNGYKEMLSELPNLVEDALSASQIVLTSEDKELINQHGSHLFSEFAQRVEQFQRQAFVGPITSSVSLLPKEELAAMAEALVNLTSFKRKVTISAETVGGPIDVAVISKGDGFIWIKRKHYFDSSLNHQFFQNYSRGDTDD